MQTFSCVDITEELARGIADAEAALALEQAVHGLDVRDERALQTLLASHLATSYEVAREVHYPRGFGKKLTHRQRCDLVLTQKGRPLQLDSAVPAEAFWLELKVAHQFRTGGRLHTGYGALWRQAIMADVRKMQDEPAIHAAALALVVFNESTEILAKDLELFEALLVKEQLRAGFRVVRSVAVSDRIGHTLCSVALWPTIQR